MADIRINALPTTASASSSDDYIALDGATNGTRKLNAYSPTFGGNLTVSGTGTHSFNGPVSITGTSASNLLRLTKSGAGSKTFGIDNALDFRIYADNGSTELFKLTDGGNATLSGNLTVSGTGQQTFLGRISSSHSTAGSSSSAFVNTASNGYGLLAQGGSTLASTQYVFRAANYLNADAFVVYSDSATLAGNLTVSGGTATISTALAAGTQTINLSGGASTNGSIIANGTTGELRTSFGPSVAWGGFHTWYTDTAERMRLFANGNLGIGTTTNTGQKLQVNGSAIIGSTSFEEFGTNGTAQFYAASGGTAALTLTSAGYYDWRIRGGSTSMTIVRDNTDMLSFDSNSNATFAGNILLAAAKGMALNGQTNPAVHGISSSGNNLSVVANTGGVVNLGTASNGALFTVDGNGVIKTQGGTAVTPASASATGTAGMIQWDASYIYVCTAANTWKRVAIATWP